MGDVVRGAANRGLQKRATGEYRLTKTKRQTFLDELAGSANVDRACRAAGAAHSSFYRLRSRDAEFARSWEEAMATGYALLEAGLMAAAFGSGGGGAGEGGDPLIGDPTCATREPLDRDLALALLKRRDTAANRPPGERRPGGTRTKHVPMADVEAALLRQLKLLEKRLGGKRCEACGRSAA
ncbi:hypothetical protein [uncultured Sphingomonas sp.]|uniref:hypothetical protein n=1 Tax=uncultured Sphingomonas sp. TaxID=158754 RepID=UPI0035CB8A0B